MGLGQHLKKTFTLGRGVWDPSHRFETSWLLPPYALFAFRALFSLYAFTTLFFVIGWTCTHPTTGTAVCQDAGDNFSYFTTLTYWGLAFYFLVSSIHTFAYARWGVAALDNWPRALQVLHALYYSTITCFPFLVTVVYWVLLYGPSWFPTPYLAWSNISQHALNSLFALFEVLIPRTEPQPPVHMLWLIVLLALYLGLAYLTHATKGFYTYSFLDPGKQGALVAGYVFGIAVAILIVFGIVSGVIWVRRRLTEGKQARVNRAAGASGWEEESAHQLKDMPASRRSR